MYRTDKEFMKNPATAPSRIYIGNLPKTIIADDLEAAFSKHGKLLGMVINNGYAFIQYEFENEAHKAIQAENGNKLIGRKIIVRQAFGGNAQNKAPPLKIEPPPRSLAQQTGPPPPLLSENAPPKEDKLKYDRPSEQDQEMQEEEMDTGPIIRPPPQKFGDEGNRQSRVLDKGNRGVLGQKRSRDRLDFQAREAPPRAGSGFYGGGGRGDYSDNYGPAHGAPPPDIIAPAPDRNDCEIIVVSRALTEYAEFIEGKLKQLGLIVDLLFPNEDVPLGRVLANISSRGCLYAILVMPQNEEHRSLTLNILHGIPQEHRNMPVDDALLLVSRNFEAYMRGETLVPEDPSKPTLAERHSQPVQMLINLLAENRMLSTSQYDRLIKYLQDRKAMQHEHEVAEGVTEEGMDEGSNKQNELQSRILNILNKTNEKIPTSITAPEPPPKEEPTPLLKDPSVQKALDSLLSGDMFKSMTGAL